MAEGDKYINASRMHLGKEQILRSLINEDANGKPFLYKGNSEPPAPASVLQPWYDSLSVKPSEGLWTDLKIMADGMNEDGDWSEMDFFSLLAALETNEQRLRPLKTTSGDDLINIDLGGGGITTLNANGALGNGAGGCLSSKWNPVDNGVKYTLNSASLFLYGNTTANTASNYAIFSSVVFDDDSGNDFFTSLSRQVNTTSVTTGTSRALNSVGLTIASASKSKINGNNNFPYFIGNKRTGASSSYSLINGTTATPNTAVSIGLCQRDLGILGSNFYGTFISSPSSTDYARSAIAGSGSIDESRLALRLNTFFTSRGLAIYS